jgi:hypothetical protein
MQGFLSALGENPSILFINQNLQHSRCEVVGGK